MSVPTLHIRNVPEQVYDALRERAEREGRSLNGLVARILGDAVERDREAADLVRQLDAFREEFTLGPADPTPEDVIRDGREERARRLDDLARDL